MRCWDALRIAIMLSTLLTIVTAHCGEGCRKALKTSPSPPNPPAPPLSPGSRCDSQRCWFELFGSAVPHGSNFSFEPAMSMCRAAITNHGMLPLSEVIKQKLRSEEAVEIAVLGSSVSCGSVREQGLGHPDRTCGVATSAPTCLNHAFPRYLNTALQGCLRSRVLMYNLCHEGIQTDYWIGKLAAGASPAWNGSHHEMYSFARADVVLVEMGASDVVDQEDLNSVHAVQARTETLLRLLLALPQKPLLMWVNAAWRDFNLATYTDAEGTQLAVMRHYGVPHTSLRSAFMPLSGDLAKRDLLRKVYFQDMVHPTRTGHKIIAAVLAHRLLGLLLSQDAAPRLFSHQPPLPYVLPSLLVPSAAHFRFAKTKGKIMQLDLSKTTTAIVSSASKGFAIETDSAGKRGLIAHNVGDTVLISLGSERGTVQLGAMYSYEHNGALHAELFHTESNASAIVSAPSVDGQACEWHQTSTASLIGSMVADMRWTHTASLRQTIQVGLIPEGPASAARQMNASCAWLRVTVVSTPDGREENKIKLLDLHIV